MRDCVTRIDKNVPQHGRRFQSLESGGIADRDLNRVAVKIKSGSKRSAMFG